MSIVVRGMVTRITLSLAHPMCSPAYAGMEV